MENRIESGAREAYEAPTVDDVPLQSSDMMTATCKTPTVGTAFSGSRGCHPPFNPTPCRNS